jgi:phospholipid/cholesterol/gamma-HCH transport system substrate-binding protein
MPGSRRLSLIVGGFVVASLGALAIAILSLTSETGLFRPQYELIARFENVQGLMAGAPVWLAGKEVGRIESVTFDELGSERPVRVVMRIQQDVKDRIREDSVATIGTIGLLGDSYVEVTVGSPSKPRLEDGAVIESVTPASLSDVVARGTKALDNIASLAENLDGVVGNFAAAEGGEKAAAAVAAVSDIVTEVRQGKGLLHSLIYDPYGGQGIESIQHSLETLESILLEVREGEGILHTLIYDRPTDQDIVMEALQAGARLNSILAKVDRGEGTLGLLLNDPTLYDDLKTLLGGAQRSAIVRTMIRWAADGN